MTSLICTVCPQGCLLRVDTDDGFAVTGNKCPRGAAYALAELKNPVRTVTSTVRVKDGRLCPVKTREPIPKALVAKAVATLEAIRLSPPIELGQVVLENVCETGIAFIATKTIRRQG